MATLQQIREKADTKLANFWSVLQEKQNAYYAKHGKYFQLLITPEQPVVDGVDTDATVRKPNDEKHTLDVDIAFNEKIPFNIQIDEWKHLIDAGYSATITVTLTDGRVYKRTRQHTQEDTGWYLYDPLKLIS